MSYSLTNASSSTTNPTSGRVGLLNFASEEGLKSFQEFVEKRGKEFKSILAKANEIGVELSKKERELVAQQAKLKALRRVPEPEGSPLELVELISFRTRISSDSTSPNTCSLQLSGQNLSLAYDIRPMDFVIVLASENGGTPFSSASRNVTNPSARWYPAFVGFVTTISQTFSAQDMFNINVECEDLTKLMTLTRVLTSPAINFVATLGTGLSKEAKEAAERMILLEKGTDIIFRGVLDVKAAQRIGGNLVLSSMTAGEIIRFLVEASGITEVFSNFGPVIKKKLQELLSDTLDKQFENSFLRRLEEEPVGVVSSEVKTQVAEINNKRKQSGSLLPGSVEGKGLLKDKIKDDVKKLTESFQAFNKMIGQVVILGEDTKPFTEIIQRLTNFESEFITARDLATQVARVMHFEFYCSESGQIVFKPMSIDQVYDRDSAERQRYTVNQEEIITFNFDRSDSDVFTAIKVTGEWDYIQSGGEVLTETLTFRQFIPELFARYGWRMHELRTPLVRTAESGFWLGKSLLDRLRGREYTGAMTTVFNPRLQVAKNIVLPWYEPNRYYYVTGISHNFTVGRGATTTLTLTHGRDEDKPYAPILLSNDASLFENPVISLDAFVTRVSREIIPPSALGQSSSPIGDPSVAVPDDQFLIPLEGAKWLRHDTRARRWRDKKNGIQRPHEGIDIAVSTNPLESKVGVGARVRAAKDGVVIQSELYVTVLQHKTRSGKTYYTRYVHVVPRHIEGAKPLNVGDKVRAGEVIGRIADQGRITREKSSGPWGKAGPPHVHFEVSRSTGPGGKKLAITSENFRNWFINVPPDFKTEPEQSRSSVEGNFANTLEELATGSPPIGGGTTTGFSIM